MKALPLFTLLIALSGYACAADTSWKEVKTLSLKSEFNTTSDWHVTAWQPNGKNSETGNIAAKLCFWDSLANQQKNCTSITSMLPNDGMMYYYQTFNGLELIHPDATSPPLLKFSASFSGGGSGSLGQISFWKYDRQINRFEPSSHITLTEQGEYHLFNKGDLAGMLTTANAVWQAGETHFSSHHFYIEVYRFDSNNGYVKQLGYLTPSSYPSFDEAEKIDVISHEIPRIEKLLVTIKSQKP